MIKTKNMGFSLIELLVVVAIIGILASVGVVGYQNYTDNTRSTLTEKYQSDLFSLVAVDIRGLQSGAVTTSNIFIGGGTTGTRHSLGSTCSSFVNDLGISYSDWDNPFNSAQQALVTSGITASQGQILVFCEDVDTDGSNVVDGSEIGNGGSQLLKSASVGMARCVTPDTLTDTCTL